MSQTQVKLRKDFAVNPRYVMFVFVNKNSLKTRVVLPGGLGEDSGYDFNTTVNLLNGGTVEDTSKE